METCKAIDDLKPSLSAGPDGVSNRLLKCLKFEIALPFTIIANESVNEGIFPSIWKLGSVVPIHKKGSK